MAAPRELTLILDQIAYEPPRDTPLIRILEGFEQEVLDAFIQLNEVHWKDPQFKDSQITLCNYSTGKVEHVEGPSGKVRTYFLLRENFTALHRIFGLDISRTLREIPFDRQKWFRKTLGFYNWRIRRLYEANFANELLENSYSRSTMERACKEHSEKCHALFLLSSDIYDRSEEKVEPVNFVLSDEWDPRLIDNQDFWIWEHFLTVDRNQETPRLIQIVNSGEHKEEEHKEPEPTDNRVRISTEVESNKIIFAHALVAVFSTPFIDPIRTTIFIPYCLLNLPSHIVDTTKRFNQILNAQQPKQNLVQIGAFAAGLGAGYLIGNYLPVVGSPALGPTMSLVVGNFSSVFASRAIKRYNRFFYGTENPELLPTQQMFANVEAKNSLLSPGDISEMFESLDNAIRDEKADLREKQGFAITHKLWGFSWIKNSGRLQNLLDARSALENGNLKEFVQKAERANLEVPEGWKLSNVHVLHELAIEESAAPAP